MLLASSSRRKSRKCPAKGITQLAMEAGLAFDIRFTADPNRVEAPGEWRTEPVDSTLVAESVRQSRELTCAFDASCFSPKR